MATSCVTSRPADEGAGIRGGPATTPKCGRSTWQACRSGSSAWRVGAPFAVLVAEQLAASGAELVISITSAGQIGPIERLPCFVLIDRALRGEGTSSHYQPPTRWSYLDDKIRARLDGAFAGLAEPVLIEASWTTDAPYRETETAIAAAASAGVPVWKWKRPRCTHTPRPASVRSGVSPMSPTRWPPPVTISKRGVDNGVHDALAAVRAAAGALL